ncbi:hypothetical protein FHR22_003647 [Sphingopyxis panaciterrae]|uniref:hypothetical protein n=1 Tax=Sphingopyxis panaciterrae TaxID=363841 RepID=UPI00141E6F70|nr:hypothetical protein [Sphingopyxis panaciterrae]NIJ38923.1 hypothetical protein [Sphingopyxis panaciterrae]
MTRNSDTNWLSRAWAAVTEASAAAVAIQYAAPWNHGAPAPRTARDQGACAA